MTFNDTQIKALKSKLSHRHVKERGTHGGTIAYLEGWHVIAEANRIFGFENWDRQTLAPNCIWSSQQRGQESCFYTTKVRIAVRSDGSVTLREGIGTGFGRAREPELAHEIALKAAETDATKRALATFGNAFGLALYDRDRSQVTKAKGRRQREYQGPPVSLKLARKDGTQAAFIDVDAFVAAAIAEIAMFTEVDNLYAYWSANLASFAELRLRSDDADPAGSVIAAIQERLRQLVIVQPMTEAPAHCSEPKETFDSRASYGFPKEKRVRDKAHLAFVARQPCLVCGRRPAQAHHLRFAQPRAMALKVSDEFTLPLCNTHHDALHRTGDERAWWARHGFVEPLKIAGRLWAASHDPSQKAEDWYGQGPMEVVEDSKTVSKSSSPTGKDETRDPAD